MEGLGHLADERDAQFLQAPQKPGLAAVALVKPNRSLAEVDARSVRKKMKDKAFARSVNRSDILAGAAELGLDLDQHIAFCIQAMQARAADLGLA